MGNWGYNLLTGRGPTLKISGTTLIIQDLRGYFIGHFGTPEKTHNYWIYLPGWYLSSKNTCERIFVTFSQRLWLNKIGGPWRDRNCAFLELPMLSSGLWYITPPMKLQKRLKNPSFQTTNRWCWKANNRWHYQHPLSWTMYNSFHAEWLLSKGGASNSSWTLCVLIHWTGIMKYDVAFKCDLSVQ